MGTRDCTDAGGIKVCQIGLTVRRSRKATSVVVDNEDNQEAHSLFSPSLFVIIMMGQSNVRRDTYVVHTWRSLVSVLKIHVSKIFAHAGRAIISHLFIFIFPPFRTTVDPVCDPPLIEIEFQKCRSPEYELM